MKTEDLRDMLEQHSDWLAGEECGGRADLSGADLSGADLSGADLSGADLSGADLRWADLSGADLSGADLSGAYLRWARLYATQLDGADLRGAQLDYSTWPLCCGTLKARTDDRLVVQLLYHTLALAQGSDLSKELISALDTDELIAQANRFHRVKECGHLARWPEQNGGDHERAAAEAESV